jgi:hypothetical protein
VSRIEPEETGRRLTERDIREALDEMVARNRGHRIFVEGTTTRGETIKAKLPT